MADLIKVTENVRLASRSEFSSHSGNVYVREMHSENGSLEVWEIWAASPTVANFNDAPVGSIMHDTDDWTKLYRHDAATTWKTLTFS